MPPSYPRLIFITGTDTGVGKTLLTGLLLHYLRDTGCHALAMKPFCSGGTEDAELLDAVQEHELPRHLLNPFSFPGELAPLVAARKLRRRILAPQALRAIRRVAELCDCLLIEGAGGLLAPLGERFSAADLIASLACEVVVVAPNRLGTINHVLLTVRAFQAIQIQDPLASPTPSGPAPAATASTLAPGCSVVLMDQAEADLAAGSNASILGELLSQVPVFAMPFLGPRATALENLAKNARSHRRKLRQISATQGDPSRRR